MSRRSGLFPRALTPLPLGAIRPRGWLLRQLRVQADGLSGHLDEFWPDVADSGWIGGAAEGWERGPYWLDGLVPLAYLLGDDVLKAKVQFWIDYIIGHQRGDGWLGPVQGAKRYRQHDPWPQFVVFKALTQYAEATRDRRVIPVMVRALRKLDALLDEQPLFDWGRFRWADLVLSIQWMLERAPHEWLLGLAAKAQRQGYDWRNHFGGFKYPAKVTAEQCDLSTHVVNNAMALKQPAVWYRHSHDELDRRAVSRALATLDRYHGQATGVFTGDEHYAGKNPSQGTELCAVVEMMFSLEVLVSILGDPAHAELLERIAFNALPATFKPDMWAHQYDQQANQVVCRVTEDRIYTSNGPDANIFGLEPNYGCCTANMHQGWPKFASHLWMGTPDGGIAAISYAPCAVTHQVQGSELRIRVETDYPFGDMVGISVAVDAPSRFPLLLRIPPWASGAEVSVGGKTPVSAEPGTFHRVDREWRGETAVMIRLPMEPRYERRFHNSVVIHGGPLVYALRIDEDWRQIGGQPPHAEWEVYPTSPWNCALVVDERRPSDAVRFESRSVGRVPFSPKGAPVMARTVGRRLPGWSLEHGAAATLPHSPVVSEEPPEELVLIPYGCTNLRVTEFPVLAD